MRILVLLALCFTLTINAQTTIESDSITQLDEIVLIDALKSKRSTGVTPSDIISAKVFQNYSPVEMVSALNQITGVYVLSGALNTNRITVRGIGARTLFGTDKLRLYYNEIPVINGAGSSEIEQFDLENLSQIEVVKGPKATAFGANLGGAILLTPKEALGLSTNFSNNFTTGSFGLLKNNLSFNHYDGKLRLGVQYGHMETDGYRQNSNFERDGFLLNTSYRLNEKSQVSLLLNHIDFTAQIPSSLGATAFAENPQQATFTWRASQGFEANNTTLVGVSYQRKLSENLENTSSIFYNYLDKTEARFFGILEEITKTFGFRTRFVGSFNLLGKSSQYTLGAELFKDEYDWDEFQNLYQENNGNGSLKGEQFARNKEFRTQLNTFGTILVPFTDAFTMQLGLNLNNTKYNFQDQFNLGTTNKSAQRQFKTIALPSINFNYQYSENQKYYANISRGFSNPSLEETLTPDGVINPDIEQEIGVNYELGTSLYLNDKKLHINATIYQMNVNNLLVSERVNEDQLIGKNAGKTRHSGLELALNYRLKMSKYLELQPFLNYTFNAHKFVEFIDEDEDFSGNNLTGVPKHLITSGLQMRWFEHFYWNITHQYVDAIPLTDANTISSDSFNVYGMRMGYQKKLYSTFTLGIDFGINNLFDSTYAQSVLINTQGFGGNEPRYFYPGNPINYYVGFRLGYRL